MALLSLTLTLTLFSSHPRIRPSHSTSNMPRQHLTPNACLVCRRKRTKVGIVGLVEGCPGRDSSCRFYGLPASPRSAASSFKCLNHTSNTTTLQCDGQQPCRRCLSRGEDCTYEDKKWRTKDHLRSEIERLRTEQQQGQALLRALTNDDPERWDMVVGRMKAGDPPETIAESILVHSSKGLPGASSRDPPAFASNVAPASVIDVNGAVGVRSGSAGSALEQFMPRFAGPFRGGPSADALPARRFSLPDSLDNRRASLFPTGPPGLYAPSFNLPPHRHSHPLPHGLEGPNPHTHTWTRVTSDGRLVQRLLDKFFASSLPYLSLLSQRHFMHDFREGSRRYCSEALVNAVLGMACKVATATSQLVSRVSFGDAFMGEARALLARGRDHGSLPYIQALGILALSEMAQGNEEEASDLAHESVRACIRFFIQTQQPSHSHDADFRAVRALAYCGGFSLIR